MKYLYAKTLLVLVMLMAMSSTVTAGDHKTRLKVKAAPMTIEEQARQLQQRMKGATPIDVGQMKAQVRSRAAEEEGNWEALIDEDFSRFTAGTEDEPDGTMYPTDYFETYSNVLPDDLFNLPGWWGIGVYQAGGNCALAYPNVGGYLDSPMMNMSGRLRITTRVKAINAKAMFFLSILADSYENPVDPIGAQMNLYQLKPEDGWQEITLETVNPWGGDDCFLQVNAMCYNKGGLVFDYVKVERDRDFVSVPSGLSAKHFTDEGFTAQWTKAYGADSYLVTLYQKAALSEENFVSANTFDGVTSAEGTLGGLAQGWTGTAYGTHDGQLTTDEGYEGGKALLLTSNDDVLEFDANGSEILNGSLAVKRVSGDENSYAEMCVDLYDEAQKYWDTWIIRLPAMGEDWKVTDFVDAWQQFVPGAYTKMRIRCGGFGYSATDDVVALSGLSCETTPLTETTLVKKDLATTDNNMTFTGLDMNQVYSFTVQGLAGNDRQSEVSEPFLAYGVAAPKVLDATDIDKRGAYTANWEPSLHATSYELNSYEVYTATADVKDYPVFTETFNKCTEGTRESLVFLGNANYMQLDEYTDNKGWMGNGTLLCNGMVGCFTDEYGYYYFEMFSPAMNLDNNGGNYKVTVDFELDTEGETLIIQGDETMYQAVEAGTSGRHTATVEMTGGTQATKLMFYTLNGAPFLLDNVTVTQDLKAGDKLYTLLSSETVMDETSARVSGLERKDNVTYAYNLYAYYDRYGTVYKSDLSDTKFVELTTGIAETLGDPNTDAERSFYDLSGRKVSTLAGAKGVFVVKEGNKVKKVLTR
ncbi:MAG: hypothetical protein ACI3YD_05990 [Alloprevotella sp.]